MRIAKWGNSLAIRLPVAVVEALRLQEGSEVTVRIAGPREFEIAPDRTRENAIRTLQKFRGRLPAGFTFDRDEADAR